MQERNRCISGLTLSGQHSGLGTTDVPKQPSKNSSARTDVAEVADSRGTVGRQVQVYI
jgi:hypothetical protein